MRMRYARCGAQRSRTAAGRRGGHACHTNAIVTRLESAIAASWRVDWRVDWRAVTRLVTVSPLMDGQWSSWSAGRLGPLIIAVAVRRPPQPGDGSDRVIGIRRRSLVAGLSAGFVVVDGAWPPSSGRYRCDTMRFNAVVTLSVGNRLDFHNHWSVWPNQSTIDCIIGSRTPFWKSPHMDIVTREWYTVV